MKLPCIWLQHGVAMPLSILALVFAHEGGVIASWDWISN